MLLGRMESNIQAKINAVSSEGGNVRQALGKIIGKSVRAGNRRGKGGGTKRTHRFQCT